MERSRSLHALSQAHKNEGWMPLPSADSLNDLTDSKRLAGVESSNGGGPKRGAPVNLPGRAVALSRPLAKKARLIKWLILHASGAKQTLCLDKRQLIQHFQLDMPVRDMRLLDNPPSTALGGLGANVQHGQLLVRDNAILLSMEYVKMIITADKAILPLPEGSQKEYESFITTLENTIHERLGETHSQGGGMAPLGPSILLHPPPHAKEREDNSPVWNRLQVGSGGQTVKFVPHGQGLPHRESTSGAGITQTGSHGAQAHMAHALPRSMLYGGLDPTEGGDGPQTPHGPLSQQGTGDELPFELHCLECGLGEVCRHLAKETDALQAAANPALDDLVQNSNRRNLEKVRRIKTMHQRLLARAEVVRDTLQKLVEDDADMFRMCLSRCTARKLSAANHALHHPMSSASQQNLPATEPQPQQPTDAPPQPQPHPALALQSAFAAYATQASGSPPSPPGGMAGIPEHLPHEPGSFSRSVSGVAGSPSMTIPQHRPSLDLPAVDPSSLYAFGSASIRSASMLAIKLRHMQNMAAAAAAQDLGGPGRTSDASGTPAAHNAHPMPAMSPHPGVPVPVPPAALLDEDDLHDVLDVENLLEAYEQMVDATHATLVGIGEYIDDTEDLVNINLDYSRNNLIRFELLITMATFSLAFYSCLAGVLGENLVLPEMITQDISGFVLVNGLLIMTSFLIFTGLVQWVNKQGLSILRAT